MNGDTATRPLTILIGALLAPLILPHLARAQVKTPETIDGGPYVPTPDIVVSRMLELADVRRDDLVVDLARAVAAAGTHIPPHTHTADTVAYLASGRATFRSGQNLEDTHELVAGDWLFVPAGMVHVEETPADSAAATTSSAPGGSWVSACRNSSTSARVHRAPAFICTARPRALSTIWSAYGLASATVSSLLPPSTTINSAPR